MAESIAPPHRHFQAHIEALSAGICSIAPTLLVLELRLPEAAYPKQ
jgi:uncharacterized membrane protein